MSPIKLIKYVENGIVKHNLGETYLRGLQHNRDID
jgi:hypothetical protein